MKESRKRIFFWTLMFISALLVLARIGYSDGDDAFFYQYAREMGFWEYLSWRYRTWVGRMSGEAMVYLVFRRNLWFWRVVNAFMLVLLPIGILKLAKKAAGLPKEERFDLPSSAMAVTGYFLMAAGTLGYAAVWVNGSIFYTWSFACGIWALMPLADLIFATGEFRGRQLCYSLPCAVVASMSIEQMGAVLLTFEMLGVWVLFWRHKRIHWGMLLQLFLTVAAYMVLFLAPGNSLRVAEEIRNWMPQYDSLTFGAHLFLTVQWMLSSFANENRLFLCGIWAVGILLLLQKKERQKSDRLWVAAAALFTGAACLPLIKVTALSDLGMHIGDSALPVEQVPEIADLTPQNKLALFWWGLALVFTFFYLWRISQRLGSEPSARGESAARAEAAVILLVYLAGIASEAVLYFSPTMYASGGRVYYLTDLLYLFLILALSFHLRSSRWRNGYYLGMMCVGLLHFIGQFPAFAMYLL